LETKYCVSTSSFVIHASTSTLVKNSTITNPSDQMGFVGKAKGPLKSYQLCYRNVNFICTYGLLFTQGEFKFKLNLKRTSN
jgi:hypothetical protein